ncbi:MAG: hypothetical protein ACYC4P_12525 [Thermoanaerobaculia bacterium]
MIQAILEHVNQTTTESFTRVAVTTLNEIRTASHTAVQRAVDLRTETEGSQNRGGRSP